MALHCQGGGHLRALPFSPPSARMFFQESGLNLSWCSLNLHPSLFLHKGVSSQQIQPPICLVTAGDLSRASSHSQHSLLTPSQKRTEPMLCEACPVLPDASSWSISCFPCCPREAGEASGDPCAQFSVLSSVLSSVLCSPGVAPLDLRVLTCKSVSQGCRSLSLHLTRRKAKTCRLWSSSAGSPGLEFLLRAQSPRQLGLPESWWDWSVSSTPSSLPSSERPVEGVSKGGES